MTVNSAQLIGIDLDGLKSIVRNVVTSVLLEHLSLISDNLKRPSDEYLVRKEAAEFLRISETTLYTLDRTQVLPARRLNGRVLYLKSDLLNFSERSA